MFLDLTNLIDNIGGRIERKGVCDFTDVATMGIVLVKAPVTVSVTVYNDSGEVFIEISAEYTLSLECDRCACGYEVAHSEVFTHKVWDAESELGDLLQPDESDKLFIDPIVWDDVVSTVPSHALCKPDCKGLCLNCGGNFNDGPCGCDDPRPVPFDDE